MSDTGSLPRIRDLIIRPDAFFESVSNMPVRLLRPFLLILAGALVFVIVILLFFVWARTGWSLAILNPASFAGAYLFSLAGTAFLAPFVFWVAAAIIFQGISRAIGGTGSFSLTLQNTGYGMLPWSVSALIPLAAYLHKFFTYTGGPVSGGYTGIWMMPAGSGLLPLILILIWSGFLWVPAVQHTHGFTRRKAMAVVGAPVLVFVLLLLPCIAGYWYL